MPGPSNVSHFRRGLQHRGPRLRVDVVRAIADYCLSVPDDIAIISCDQFIDGNYLTPRLTSLDRHTQTLGLYVIQYLLSMIQNNDPPEKPDLSPDLVIRESSGKHLPQA